MASDVYVVGMGLERGLFLVEFLIGKKKHDLNTKNNPETKVGAETNCGNGSARR